MRLRVPHSRFEVLLLRTRLQSVRAWPDSSVQSLSRSFDQKISDYTRTCSTVSGTAQTGTSFVELRRIRSILKHPFLPVAFRNPSQSDGAKGRLESRISVALAVSLTLHLRCLEPRVDHAAESTGKHYNRFRRQRICEYTTDYNFHAAARAKEESNKEATKPHRGNRGTASVATTSTEGTPAALGVQPPSRGGPPQSSVAATGSSLAVQIPSVRTGKLGADDDEDDEGNSDDSDPVRAPVRKKRRPNHYGSPDTPFVANDSNSGTGSDDSDEDDEEGHHEPNGPSPPTRPEPPPSLPSIQVDPIAPVRVPVARVSTRSPRDCDRKNTFRNDGLIALSAVFSPSLFRG